MSFPGGSLDEVRNFLDTNHPEQYLVFNLSDKSYDTAALHGQVRACVHVCVCVFLSKLCPQLHHSPSLSCCGCHCTGGRL